MKLTRISRLLQRYALPVLFGVSVAQAGGATYAQGNAKAAKFYEDALVRFEKKDIDGAIIQLKNALQIDPSMLPVQLLLGRTLLQNGELVAAEVALIEALRLGVNRAEVVVLLGRAFLAQGKHKLLLEQAQFNPSGLPQPVQIQLHLLRAAASTDLGDPRAAMKAIEDARALDPKSPEAWAAEVPIRIRTRQFREATAAVDKAISLAPNLAEGWYQKGSILHVQGDLPGALAAYDNAVKLDTAHIDARVTRAGILIDLNRAADAAKDVAEVQSQAPAEPRAAYLKAILAERAGDDAASRAALKEVVGMIDPVPMDFIRFRPQLLMLNGLSHFGLNEREKAKQYLEAFQKAHGNSPASKVLAQLYAADSNVDKAIELLEGYLKAQPADGQAMTLLGSALMTKGRYAKATALMQEALRTRDAPEYRTVLGLSLIRGGQQSMGLAELEAVFKKSPLQLDAGTTLIDLYLRNGQAKKAITVAEILIKQAPNNAVFHNLMGMAQAQNGDGKTARVSFEQALKLAPAMTGVALNLARLDIATKAFDSANARLSTLLKADEKNAEAMYEMAVLSDRRGKTDEAKRWLDKANDLSGPREVRWGLALVEFHLRNAQPGPALIAAKKVSAKAPENLQVLMVYARAQLAAGDRVGARSSLAAATRFAEYNAQLQVEIATLQLAANNIDGASYSLDKALAGQSDYLPAMALMGDVELRRGERVKAEKRAREVIAKFPSMAIGHGLLGDIASANGQTAVALASYRRAHQVQPSTLTLLRLFAALAPQDGGKAALQMAEQWIKLHPRDVAVRVAAADAHARAGNFGAARSAYETVLKLTPDDSVVLNNLANVLLRLKDPSALKIAELAVAKAPNNPNSVGTLGWILLQNGQTDRALQLLRDARLREPGNLEVRYYLAAALAKTGRNNEARDELQAALKPGQRFESVAAAQALLQSLK